MAPLHLVHVDAALIVVDKPAGLLAVPGRGEGKQDCALSRVQAQWPEARVVHRLDMATSGLLLFARGAAAQRLLSMAFEQRAVAKRYVAIVAGRLDPAQGSIDLPLAADWPNRPRQQVDRARGKPSLTHYEAAEYDSALDRSRVRLEPVTGRSHQLRVHLLAIGHPIVGDALYAPPDVAAASGRLLLHASRLELVHPTTGRALAFDNPAPF